MPRGEVGAAVHTVVLVVKGGAIPWNDRLIMDT